jgi:phosphate transport system protein
MTFRTDTGPSDPHDGSRSTTSRQVELDRIDDQISRLFELVADGLSAATSAFLAGDPVAAGRVVRAEVAVDELHRVIEDLLEEQLGRVVDGIDACGLARLVLALRIVPELERSGDLVAHIATRSSPAIVAQLPPAVREVIAEMGRSGVELWRRVAGTFAGVDDATVAELRAVDDRIDDLHGQLRDELAITPIPVAAAIEMGLVARFFERLGDHAVNVARRLEADVRSRPELAPLP